MRPWVAVLSLFPSRGWAGAALGPKVAPGQQPSQQHSLYGAEEEQQQQDGEVVNWGRQGTGRCSGASPCVSGAQRAEHQWVTGEKQGRLGKGAGLTEQWVAGGGAGQGLHQGGVEDEVTQQQCHLVAYALNGPEGQQPPAHVSQQQCLCRHQESDDGLERRVLQPQLEGEKSGPSRRGGRRWASGAWGLASGRASSLPPASSSPLSASSRLDSPSPGSRAPAAGVGLGSSDHKLRIPS
uniref:EXOC7 protein n=1 Tax=Homo sapiens TaxID=9606 RepID=Q96BU6_HUMAN